MSTIKPWEERLTSCTTWHEARKAMAAEIVELRAENARLREHGAGLCEEAADMLEADAVPQEPVAYAIFAENWNIRIWSTEQQHVKRIAQEQGLSLVKLYTAPQRQPAVPQEPVAWQPIETAPKDGSKVLLFWYGNNTKFISVAVWRGDKAPDYPWRSAETGSAIGGFGQCHLEEKERTWEQGATHWMPLPAPPLPDNAEVRGA